LPPLPWIDLLLSSSTPRSHESSPIARSAALQHFCITDLFLVFFTHCHPARAIIHKPTFSADLSHNKVPRHLLLAVCALAAPLSKQPRIRTTPSRFAGKPFAQEALSLMFDGAGRLVCEADLAAAQALCILQIHDITVSQRNVPWNSRFHGTIAAASSLRNLICQQNWPFKSSRSSASITLNTPL